MGVGTIEQVPPAPGARPRRPLVIVHVMKTGGFSLLYQVMANVSRKAIWGVTGPDVGDDVQMSRYTSVELLQALDADARSTIEVVMGHLPFAVVDVAGFSRGTVATIVREPVARTVSFLSMCQASYPEHRHLSLEQIYEDEFFGPRLIRNHQTKMLGMTVAQATIPPPKPIGPPHPALVETLIAEGYFDTARCVFEALDTPLAWLVTVDESTLDRARRNLDRVDVLGVHDRYDEFLARLGGRMGWTFDRDIRVNRSASVPVSASFRRHIEEDNGLDVELYEHARQLVRGA